MDIVGHTIGADLYKARPHKYVKRTGSPGNYRYWYKMPDGSIKADDDMQASGKLEHARRMVAARIRGMGAHDNNYIATKTGLTKRQVQLAHSNIQREQRRQQVRGTSGHQGHDFEEHHMKEALLHDVEHADYHEHVGRHKESARAVSARTVSRRTSRADASAAAGLSPSDAEALTAHRRASRAATPAATAEPAATPAPTAAPARPARSTRRRATTGRAAGDIPETDEEPRARRPRATASAPTRPASSTPAASGSTSTPAPAGDLASILAKLKTEHGVDLSGTVRPADAPRNSGRQAAREQAANTDVAPNASRIRLTARDKKKISDKLQELMNGHQIPVLKIPELQRMAERLASTGQSAISAANTAFHDFKREGHISESSTPVRQATVPPAGTAGQVESDAAASRARAQAASARAQVRNQAIHPDGAAARQLHEADPEFARADEPVRAMLDAESAGENPYISRAKGIYDRVKADLKPERKETVGHIFNAIEQLKAAGQPLNEANLVNKYKELSGKRIRGISGIAEEFERGTFMGLDEVLQNKPVDIEVERMKRGFAAKQFARMKPFLNDAFNAQHPGAPPPFPTYNDLKSWSDHGSARPSEMSWSTPTGRAGGVTKAMPPEFFNSIQKIDGKPQMPPGDLPLHLVPAWNYVVKKTSGEGAGAAYATSSFGSPVGQDGKISAGNQAKFQEGVYRSAMRKYVQMRGGADQLVDIPHSKLSEIGLAHSDIFKASDIRRKIIDPVALVPFIDAELKRGVKKSWSLVVGDDQPIFKSITKGQLIAKIRQLKGLR